MKCSDIEVIARAVIVRDEHILLCQSVGSSWYFLPGGHIEPGETVEQTLRREMREEGNVEIGDVGHITYLENFFEDENGGHHELLILCKTSITPAQEIVNQEDDITLSWVSLKEFQETDLRPDKMKSYILNEVE